MQASPHLLVDLVPLWFGEVGDQPLNGINELEGHWTLVTGSREEGEDWSRFMGNKTVLGTLVLPAVAFAKGGEDGDPDSSRMGLLQEA